MHRLILFVLPICWAVALLPGTAAMAQDPAGRLIPPESVPPESTFCNPINIEYCFRPEAPNWREAADPVIVLYKGDYYLFPSKSSGYWHSEDLVHWTLVPIEDRHPYRGWVHRELDKADPADNTLPVEGYGPAAMVRGDDLYYTQSCDLIFRAKDPKRGLWEKASRPEDLEPVITATLDDWIFADDDGRVYLYGIKHEPRGVYVMELDPEDRFKPVRGPEPCMGKGKFVFWKELFRYPWEAAFRKADRVPEGGEPLARTTGEGAQMFKHNGLYYLHLAISGTQYSDYRDYAFVSRSPWGPFEYVLSNPVSFRPVGFCQGAGNTAVFADKQGRQWRVVTSRISVKHMFERRLGLYTAGCDKDNLMYTDTYLGDLPQYGQGKRRNGLGGNLVGWMLLSHNKQVTASSTLDKHPAEHAADEDIRTWWSAATGDRGEWLALDLGKPCRIHAVQVNFAEQDAKAAGRKEKHFHQYLLEVSADGRRWSPLVDKRNNTRDVPHDYVQLDRSAVARHVRLTNFHMPAGGKFAVRDLRVFGSGMGSPPDPVREFTLTLDPKNRLWVDLRWPKAAGAEGHVVRWGIAPDKLYQSLEVRKGETARTYVLTGGLDYYYTVDAFNDSGITRGTAIRSTRDAAKTP